MDSSTRNLEGFGGNWDLMSCFIINKIAEINHRILINMNETYFTIAL
jgi:hypothetical protein